LIDYNFKFDHNVEDLAQPIKLQHEKKLMNVLEKAKTQDSIQHDLFKFPGFVHPVTQTELIDLTQAALTSPTQEKLLILICPQQKTEAYMEDLVRATSKSVDSGFISTTSQALFELAEIKSGKSEKSELEKVNTLQYIDPKSAQKFLNQLPAAFLEELMVSFLFFFFSFFFENNLINFCLKKIAKAINSKKYS